MDPKAYAQLLEIFKAELDENLQSMTNCLLALEKGASRKASKELVDSLFRSAHSVKGASCSLGLDDIGELSHHLESLFSAFREGLLKMNKSIANTVLKAMDCIKESITSAASGVPVTFDLSEVLSQIDAHVPKKKNKPKPAEKTKNKQKEKKETKQDVAPAVVYETIRVPLPKIDLIATLSEELQGAKLRNDDLIKKLESFTNSFSISKNPAFVLDNFFQVNRINISTEVQVALKEIAEVNPDHSAMLNEIWRAMRDNNTDLGQIVASMQENIRVMRLVPVSVLLHPLARTVRDIAEEVNKEINFKIIGDSIEIDRLVLENLKDPLIHLIRNSIDHGIEDLKTREASSKTLEGNITIEVKEEGGHILFKIMDDGAGIDEKNVKQMALEKNLITPEEAKGMSKEEAINLIFLPGLSTKSIITDVSGRGVGMDVVLRNVESVKGVLSIQSGRGQGTTVNISVPLTLATDRGMLVSVSGQTLIVPTVSIWRILNLASSDIHAIEGRMVINVDKEVIPLYNLADILGLNAQHIEPEQNVFVIILHLGANRVGFLVDSIFTEREIAIKPLMPPLTNAKFISGAALSGRGDIMLVLSPADMIAAALKKKMSRLAVKEEQSEAKIRILVVEDSITTRTLETDILLNKGFDAKSVANGMEAWELLQRESFDLVITDIDMPVMNGFDLTDKIKKDKKLKSLPVIIVTSMAKESDKRRGVEVGANAYIVKNQFETKNLLTLINDMVGYEARKNN